jgi:putative ABC transport system substrate-binding protein
MNRREFMTVLGGAAAAWPLAAHARSSQQMRRIGATMGYAENDPEGQARVGAFGQRLQDLGWAEGRNIRIDGRWAAPGDTESRLRFAQELVALQPDLILSHGTPLAAALLPLARTIPILFAGVSDPIGSGFVASFSRPGGNVTGFITMEPTMSGKWLELLREIAPDITRVALLFNPVTAPFVEYWRGPFQASAASFGLQSTVAPVRDAAELESVTAALAREPNGGLIAIPDTFLAAHRTEVISLASGALPSACRLWFSLLPRRRRSDVLWK